MEKGWLSVPWRVGPPGVETPETGKGMYPHAPVHSEAAQDDNLQELYWVVANGIKDTGMPAFKYRHDEEELWMVASFIKRLSTITAKDYAAMRRLEGE